MYSYHFKIKKQYSVIISTSCSCFISTLLNLDLWGFSSSMAKGRPAEEKQKEVIINISVLMCLKGTLTTDLLHLKHFIVLKSHKLMNITSVCVSFEAIFVTTVTDEPHQSSAAHRAQTKLSVIPSTCRTFRGLTVSKSSNIHIFSTWWREIESCQQKKNIVIVTHTQVWYSFLTEFFSLTAQCLTC